MPEPVKRAILASKSPGIWRMSSKLHGVNPEAYFTTYVLTKLVANWPNSRLAELLIWGWAASVG